MKHIFTVLTIGAILSSFTFFSSIEEVISALKTGNAAEIARFFDNTVEINTPGNANSYSKSQAELVLKDFFNTNGVKTFTVNHKGDNAGSQYCIGSLITKGGIYRTTVYMKLKGNKQVLQSISFER